MVRIIQALGHGRITHLRFMCRSMYVPTFIDGMCFLCSLYSNGVGIKDSFSTTFTDMPHTVVVMGTECSSTAATLIVRRSATPTGP